MNKIVVVMALLVVFSAVTSEAGVSVDESKVLDRWKFRIGGFLTGLDTKIRLDSELTGEGTTGSLGYIAFNLDDWEGSVGTAIVAVEHRTWKNFGFGLGYSYSAYNVDALSTDFLGNFEYTIDGFEIYGRAAW